MSFCIWAVEEVLMTAVPTNSVQEEDYLMSNARSSIIDAPLTLPELLKKKVPAPTVDRAETVGGFSASTPLPVGGPTAPAMGWDSTWSPGPFHCSVQGWSQYTPTAARSQNARPHV